MIVAVLAAVTLMAQAAPAAAGAPASAADAAKPPPAGNVSPLTVTGAAKPDQVEETRVVCHKEPVLGSLFPKEVCATKREFAERRQQDQQQVRDWVAVKPLKTN